MLMLNRVRCRRRRCKRVSTLALTVSIDILLLTAVMFAFASAGLFHKKDDEKIKDNNDENTRQQQTPSRPPSIIEAEARTARDLSKAVAKLTKDLNTCNSRVDAIQEGFQDLYTAHLSNVDGLRKCKEGMLTTEDMNQLNVNLDKVNPVLVEQARYKEDERLKNARIEALTEKHRELIHQLEHQVQKLASREKTWERTISELLARRDLLEQREGAWERTIGELMGEIEIRAKKENWWKSMKHEMEVRISTLSKIATKERFGPGPYFVSMKVLLNESDSRSEREIIFELAPLDVMPHSIHLFLSQIAEGYWTRGTPAIALNAGHVLQACPHPCLENVDMGGNEVGYPYEDMKKAGLDVVSFQEYSTSYPHAKYTIGFAGRPSGPEFYINLMDNSIDHGSLEERKFKMGRQYEAWAKEVFGGVEEVDEEAIEPYPCFGKVIKGFNVVNEIAKGMTRASLPKDEESYNELDDSMLLRPVKISSVTILKDYDPDAKSPEGIGKEAINDEL